MKTKTNWWIIYKNTRNKEKRLDEQQSYIVHAYYKYQDLLMLTHSQIGKTSTGTDMTFQPYNLHRVSYLINIDLSFLILYS